MNAWIKSLEHKLEKRIDKSSQKLKKISMLIYRQWHPHNIQKNGPFCAWTATTKYTRKRPPCINYGGFVLVEESVPLGIPCSEPCRLV